MNFVTQLKDRGLALGVIDAYLVRYCCDTNEVGPRLDGCCALSLCSCIHLSTGPRLEERDLHKKISYVVVLDSIRSAA